MAGHTYTSTYTVLQVTPAAYNEIRCRLEKAGYEHVIRDGDDSGWLEVIDMRDIGIAASKDDLLDHEARKLAVTERLAEMGFAVPDDEELDRLLDALAYSCGEGD